MTKDYVVVKGSVKQGSAFIGVGKAIALEEAEAKLMDPQGVALMPKAKWDAQQRAKAAAKAELDKVPESTTTDKTAAKAEKGGK